MAASCRHRTALLCECLYKAAAHTLPVVQQAHFIVDEMLMNGSIVETNKQNILAPIQLLEKAS